MTFNFFFFCKNFIEDLVKEIEKQDIETKLDLDIQAEDVLQIESTDGIYILNIKSAKKELWLASPISGPHHFKLSIEREFVDTNGKELLNLLSEELSLNLSNCGRRT